MVQSDVLLSPKEIDALENDNDTLDTCYSKDFPTTGMQNILNDKFIMLRVVLF